MHNIRVGARKPNGGSEMLNNVTGMQNKSKKPGMPNQCGVKVCVTKTE